MGNTNVNLKYVVVTIILAVVLIFALYIANEHLPVLDNNSGSNNHTPLPTVTAVPTAMPASPSTPVSTILPASPPVATNTPQPVTVTVTLGSNTYKQGDIGIFQLNSTAKPIGYIALYDSNGFLVTAASINTQDWHLMSSGTYTCQLNYLGEEPNGISFQIASDARIGIWTWIANFRDDIASQPFFATFDTFTVTSQTEPPHQSLMPTVTFALGSNSYRQGDIGSLKLNSTVKVAGTFAMYDSNDTFYTILTLNVNNWVLLSNGLYGYKMLHSVPTDALFQIPSDARVGIWTCSLTIYDVFESQTYTWSFAVTPYTPTTTPPFSPQPTIASLS